MRAASLSPMARGERNRVLVGAVAVLLVAAAVVAAVAVAAVFEARARRSRDDESVWKPAPVPPDLR